MTRFASRGGVAAVAAVLGAHAIVAAVFAATAGHRGWLFHASDGQVEAGTAAHLLANGSLPATDGGFLWSMLTAPVLGLLGPDLLHALPVLVVVGAAVLAPLATVLVHRVGLLLGSATWALWLTAVWLLLPLGARAFWQERYDATWDDAMLARLLGFSGTADALSLVLLLAAATLTLRALRRPDAAFLPVGLVAGAAGAVTPSNLLVLVGIAAAVLVGRRPRALAWVAAGVAPALAALLVWRLRMPGDGLGLSLDLSWRTFSANADLLREFGWSERIVEAAPVAGLVGLARLSRPGAALIGGWLAAFLAIEMSASERLLGDGSLWAGLAPSAPAFATLVAAIPLLVPGVAARLRREAMPVPVAAGGRPGRVGAGVAAAVTVGALIWIGVAQDARPGTEALLVDGVPTPVTGSALALTPGADGLSWPALDRGEVTGYVLLGADASAGTAGPVVARGEAPPLRVPEETQADGVRVAALAGVPGREPRAYLVGPSAPSS